MRIQERCFLLAAAGLCLLGGVAYSLTIAETRLTTTSGISDEDTAGAAQSPWTEARNDTAESKSAYPTKEADIKATTEAKKKPVVDFKVKSDQKYQKPIIKDDDAKRPVEVDASMTLPASPTTSPMKPDHSSATTKPMDAADVTIPFLLHGEPIVGITATTPTTSTPAIQDTMSSTEEMRVTEETTSSRGRALNISAPEPTNSLHANITDLSDVSMDDDDKEVEGGEYVASHNETVNITSTLLPKMPVCVYGNRTYSLGEKVVRDCEEKCVCSEGGITNCQPLCVHPYVRAGRGVEDPLCQEKTATEEPCCAVILCAADSAPEPEETCVFGNQTVARGHRVDDGCSRTCVCEAGGHLKCQARCPPNETTSIANQHDRCVALADPRDSCCTITLCDVTLGDHEIKAENSTDLSVHLMDVKVLNSTAIKLKLSAKNPQDVTIEISENNHVWRQQKPDKDGVVSTLEPAHTYYVRVAEGSRTGPAIQVFLPAEVVKVANITEKMSDKNSCNYRGKSYKVGAGWYDECVHFCNCKEGGKPECNTIECSTDFELDTLNSHCVDWETVPADFVPKAPNCCPPEVRCRNNGSCIYEDVVYDNWSRLPMNVTGCENDCFCEMGNVSCRAACNPVPALPPANLLCPYQATLTSQPENPCCLQWTCASPSAHLPGMNVTTAYPGPLATDTFDRQTIDNSKRPNNKSETLKPSQEPERGAPSLWEDPKTYKTQPDATTHGLPHYPMDPGHPTVPYNGPYSPDYVPTHPTVENVFHLAGHPEKPMPTPKEKSKSKSDSKKPVEPVKPHKDMIDQYFPGPLAPNRFPDKATSTSSYSVHENQHVPGPNKLPPQQKGHLIDQPQFIPLNLHPDISGPDFPYVSNGPKGSVPPASFNGRLDHSAGPPYRDPVPVVKPDKIDPNIIIPAIPKKKPPLGDPFADADKSKASSPPILPGRPKQGQRNPDQELSSEQLYHLINLQHPGLIQLDQAPPQAHPGLYDLHQQISGQKQPPIDRGQSDYFGTSPSAPKKAIKPHIFAQKNENGQTTYHIHTPEIPNTPQQIEELLAHISQHDSNPGSFQNYPGQPAIPHNVPNGPPATLPLHIDAHIPHSGLTHLNHPFAAQTPNQSGLDHNIVPPGFPLPGSISGFPAAPPSNEITVQILEALDEHTVRLVFTVPQLLVGLHGRVELRYTSDKTNFDPSMWKLQMFAPPQDLIATQQLEFELGDLQPMTEYKVKITVKLNGLDNNPSSKIYSVRTLEKRADEATLPPQIPVDAELRAMETNSSWVGIMWKKFSDYELQFIDGVQLRYKEHDGKVYAATPLIHRSVTNYVIENLKPATKYEVGIYFIPFAGQTTELISEKTIEVITSMEPDPYSFDVKVEIKTIKSTDVEVAWSGVPYPEDKYVNIYRAIYQSDTGKEDTSTFKIAKRDSHAKTVISDLKPGTRYRLWLEIYLTNGRIKKSNVQDFVTKPGVLLPATVSQQAGKLASLPLHEGDYYGPLVIVAIVASLAILSTLILLMMLMKRRSSSKADISPRKTTSAYDNPSYKVELQQETMDL
ncbi:PREDICTED: putative epidermal cell surface receptor isoform X2 [Dinoponera quadriceps]|uniref:Epidermal cell surface receptor isoform X2 n=1 Tax=Dinoponera quadriceps TaxID=609295 RepID=A0A6P3XBP0_DINQU|nr:PREDICTED: putative epidermal cell surface receptor isoform X2 [Dinoponera quadriceps]